MGFLGTSIRVQASKSVIRHIGLVASSRNQWNFLGKRCKVCTLEHLVGHTSLFLQINLGGNSIYNSSSSYNFPSPSLSMSLINPSCMVFLAFTTFPFTGARRNKFPRSLISSQFPGTCSTHRTYLLTLPSL